MDSHSQKMSTSLTHAWLIQLGGLIGVLWVLMHVWAAWRLPFSLDKLKIIHLGVAGFLLFIQGALKAKTSFIYKLWLLMSLAILATAVFFFADYFNMVERVGMPSMGDLIAGSFLVLLVLLVTWISWRWVIPALVIGAMLYALYGNYLGGVLYHGGIDLPRLIGYSSTYFMGTLGSLTGLSANLIIHFLLFGALLQAAGGGQLIEKISLIVGSRFRSGTAQTAVVSSSMMGMVSGSIPANVAITGAFTIPLMIRRGYSREFAGAVETVASAGGQITPPIMSIVAFLIVGLTGIPYAQIVIAAALPALVFYLSISFTAMVHTKRLKPVSDQKTLKKNGIKFQEIMKEHGHLLIPVVILTWRILIGETPARAVFYANLSLVGLGLFRATLGGITGIKQRWINFGRQVYNGLAKCAVEAAKLAVVLGSIGIVMEIFTVTGFGQRLSYSIVAMAGDGSTLILSFLVAVLVLFFGMGMPSAGAYLVAVLLTAPAMITLGFPVLSVHMFVFYFAMLSSLTPPVCLGVLVAISISGGNFMGTTLTSMRLALPGFLMPFFFLYKPAMLGLGSNPLGALEVNLLLLICLFGISIFFEGYLVDKVGKLARAAFLIGSMMVLTPGMTLSWIGATIVLATGLLHLIIKVRQGYVVTAREGN